MIITRLEELMRDLHNRTPDDLIIKQGCFIIVGVGGVGTWVSILLSLHSENTKNVRFILIDGDRLEIHNLNRLPLPVTSALSEENKAKVVALMIKSFRPSIEVEAHTHYIGNDEILVLETLLYMVESIECRDNLYIIDAVDSPMLSKVLKRATRRIGAVYIGGHYDGVSATIEYIHSSRKDLIWDVESSGVNSTYRLFPSAPVVPAFIASIIVMLVLVRPQKDLIITFDDVLSEVVGKEGKPGGDSE